MGRLINIVLLFVVCAGVLGCGVKGRPLPPLNPAPLGRGEPTFKESVTTPPKKILQKHSIDDVEAEEENP